MSFSGWLENCQRPWKPARDASSAVSPMQARRARVLPSAPHSQPPPLDQWRGDGGDLSLSLQL